jgi:hypothetical protein
MASKDRTGIFIQDFPFQATQITGKRILNWCESGSKTIAEQIAECIDFKSLKILYHDLSLSDKAQYHKDFLTRQLELKPKFESNGASHIHQ